MLQNSEELNEFHVYTEKAEQVLRQLIVSKKVSLQVLVYILDDLRENSCFDKEIIKYFTTDFYIFFLISRKIMNFNDN